MTLRYMWHYGTLFVDEYPTADDAIRAAIYTVDAGDGSPHGVEADGVWITPNDPEWEAIERDVWAKQDAEFKAHPNPTHVVEVQAPDEQWAQYDSYHSLGEAITAAGRFRVARIRKTGSDRRAVWSTP